MKCIKYSLILFITILLMGDVSAQPRQWSRLHGPNTGNVAQQLLWGANGEIIVLGSLGYYVSNDSGNNWDFRVVISPNPTQQSNSGMFIASDGSYYFYFASKYTPSQDSNLTGIYLSKDKGITWSHIVKKINVGQIVEGSDNSLFFSSNPSGNRNQIFKSIDKGNSWVDMPSLIGQYSNGTTVIGGNDKYVFTQEYYNVYRIYRFSYGDEKLINFYSGLSQYKTFSYAMVDSLVFAYDDSCLYSSNGENAWDTLCNLRGIRSIIKGTGNKIFALVKNDIYSIIFSSTDFGKNWDSIASIPAMALTSNYSNPEKLLYASREGIYFSDNKGSSWSEVGLPYAYIQSLLITDENRLFVKRSDSTKLSIDKGISWINTNTTAGNSAFQMIQGPNKSAFALAGNLSVLLFDTTLNQWKQQSSFDNVEFYNYSIASDRSKYLYVAWGFSIYISDDNGFSWLNINAPNTGNFINSLEAADDGTLYFGAYPVMYRSDDHGTSWVRLLPVHEHVRLSHIKTFGTVGVLLGTEGSGLLLSSDKGNSWTKIDGNNFDTVTCITIDSKGGIVTGTNHGLWTRDPISKNWSKVALGRDADLYIGALDVASNDDIYVGTYGSSVWVGTTHYDGVRYSPLSHSNMRISPNPASERIIIDLNVPDNSKISLDLYDILGRKVAVLASGSYSGENNINFNSSGLSSGIYTLILSGSVNGTLKLVKE